MIRNLLCLSFSILIIITLEAQRSDKRGLGYGHHSIKDLETLSTGVSWWYNWYHLPDEKVREIYTDFDVEFVPMTWNGSYDKEGLQGFLTSKDSTRYLLGFNEPNFIDQANMTPTEAASKWPELEALAQQYQLELISPAVNYCGNCVSEGGVTYYDPVDYLDDFFEACENCRVDFIAIHYYGCGGLQSYLDRFKKYDRPLWVTEFACWDQDNISLDMQKSYLINAVDILENDPSVVKYAWFTGRGSGPGISLLSTDGKLTELGELYVNMPVHDTLVYFPIPGRLEAENYQRMDGIQLELTQDEDGLINVGYIDAGDYLEYQISVPEDHRYTFDLRYAGYSGTFGLFLNNDQVRQISLPSTDGWQNWQTYESEITLQKGDHTIRFEVLNGGFNLNWIEIFNERTIILDTNDREFNFFPNPVDNLLKVEVGSTHHGADFKFDLFDLLGRKVLQLNSRVAKDQISIDFSSVAPGIYLAHFSYGGLSQIRKLIVQ
ncbi:MAG: glycosyl hydrolase [Marinoscillum sp.]